nr:type A2 lanthipeptide [Streptococcus sp. KCJ4932]
MKNSKELVSELIEEVSEKELKEIAGGKRWWLGKNNHR